MKAAQTGHMVLSSLHTNDSVSAIVRLLDLGVPGYLIGSSLTGILAQRLVRKLCSCHSIEPADAEFRRRLARIGVEAPKTMAVPLGCPKCDSTGYAGRIGIFELLNFDDSVRSAVRVTARNDEIRAAARSRVEFYRRFEALLARHGLRRAANETPLELGRRAAARLSGRRSAALPAHPAVRCARFISPLSRRGRCAPRSSPRPRPGRESVLPASSRR